MAARDILSFNNPIAPRLIRCLYIVAMIVIAVMVILALVRGVRLMTAPPPPPPAAAAASPDAPPAATPAPAPRPMMAPGQRRMMMVRGFRRRPIGPFGIGRNPMLGGLWIIFNALLRGAVMLMVVRILAEIGLAILAMPRRSEI